MVSLTREDRPAGPIVTAFTAKGFRVDGEEYSGGLWLTPESAQGWSPPEIDALDATMLRPLLDLLPKPEFLVLGTGTTLRRPTAALTTAIEAKGLGVEVMDSRAAARAWGVLRAEDRWIVAALMPLN